MALLKKENLESSDAFRVAWTATPVNYDIGANDPLKLNVPGLANPIEGRPCRRIKVNGAGRLDVVGFDGITVPLPCLAGDIFDIQAVSLSSTSTATNVIVFW